VTPKRIPEPLRSQLIEALAGLLVEDLARFPVLPAEARDGGDEALRVSPTIAQAATP